MSKQKLECIQTGDMTHEEIADWENKNEAVSICFDNSGNLEMQIVCFDNNGNNPEYGLYVAMCDESYKDEICNILTDKSQIIKLRDYLNLILNKV